MEKRESANLEEEEGEDLRVWKRNSSSFSIG